MDTKALTLVASATADDERTTSVAGAARRMRFGKQVVVSGFVLALAGILGYCVAVFFGAGPAGESGSDFVDTSRLLVISTLGVLGLGTLVWLVGSFIYLHGALEADPEALDIYS